MSGEDAWLVLAPAACAGRAVAQGPRSLLHATGGGMKVSLFRGRARKNRIDALVEEISHHERQMRNALAALIDLSDPGDDLHMECRLLLERLD